MCGRSWKFFTVYSVPGYHVPFAEAALAMHLIASPSTLRKGAACMARDVESFGRTAIGPIRAATSKTATLPDGRRVLAAVGVRDP